LQQILDNRLPCFLSATVPHFCLYTLLLLLQGVKNVAHASKAAGGVGRVVLVSSMLTHPSNR
jgi:nucleoside-diphosphate-sugar epimerase